MRSPISITQLQPFSLLLLFPSPEPPLYIHYFCNLVRLCSCHTHHHHHPHHYYLGTTSIPQAVSQPFTQCLFAMRRGGASSVIGAPWTSHCASRTGTASRHSTVTDNHTSTEDNSTNRYPPTPQCVDLDPQRCPPHSTLTTLAHSPRQGTPYWCKSECCLHHQDAPCHGSVRNSGRTLTQDNRPERLPIVNTLEYPHIPCCTGEFFTKPVKLVATLLAGKRRLKGPLLQGRPN